MLNASQSQRTQSSRFLSELFGSGVQHIAFATDDLLATTARLKRNGVRLLPIPENYYDDLEAKTDLPADQLELLQAPTTSSTTAKATPSTCRSIPRPSTSASSSRSCSAAAIAAMAPPTRRCGWPRRRASPRPACRSPYFLAPGRKSSSGTPKLLSAHDTMLYWPTVKTASISCSVEYFFDSAAQVASETTEFS